MTRINLVPVTELCDKHLLAEHRELKRIPNAIKEGKAVIKNIPASFRLGEGHVRFFYNKLLFLYKRYQEIHAECIHRGFKVTYMFADEVLEMQKLANDYFPPAEAIQLSRQRIQDMMPVNAKFTPHKQNQGD